MFSTCLIDLIDRYNPTKEIWAGKKKTIEPNYIVRKNDSIKILTCNIYVDEKRTGEYFFGVINNKNKTFYLDEDEILFGIGCSKKEDFIKDYFNNHNIGDMKNKIPTYEKEQQEISPLDL